MILHVELDTKALNARLGHVREYDMYKPAMLISSKEGNEKDERMCSNRPISALESITFSSSERSRLHVLGDDNGMIWYSSLSHSVSVV